MRSTTIIFVHELTGTMRRPGFIVMTLIVPVLALLAIGIARIAMASSVPHAVEASRIGYVDGTGRFARFTGQGAITLVPFAAAEDARDALVRGDISEYFIIPSDYAATLALSRFTKEKELDTPAATIGAIGSFLASNLLVGRLPDADVRMVEGSPSITTTRLGPDGTVAADQGGAGGALIPLLFGLLLALSLIFSSTYLLHGMAEEKESRLMEILVSRVTPSQLLLGKVLGLGAAGLAQVLVWLVSVPLLLALALSTIGGVVALLKVPPLLYVLCVPCFVLGYLLFAALSACVGAVSATAREGSQLAALYSLFPFVPLWCMSLVLLTPRNPLWIVLSIFPFTAPVMLVERIGISDLPAWQLAAGLGVLALCVAAALFLGVRIFRAYLLMYGKRPGLGELMRSVLVE